MLSRTRRAAASSMIKVLLAALICFAFGQAEALAHAVLVSSTPGQGERLAEAPALLKLHFSESVTHVSLSLTDRYGRAVELEPVVSGAEVTASLDRKIDLGAYALNWRAVSEDGHPIRASIVFSIGARADMAVMRASTAALGRDVAVLIWAAKFGFYACCLFGVGGVFFTFWIGGPRPGRVSAALLAGGAGCGALSIGLLGVDETGGALVGLLSPGVWVSALDSSLARSVALASVALALALIAIFRPSAGRPLSLASLLLLGPAFAQTGHASDMGIRWLSSVALSAHVFAACFWAGALPRLRLVLKSGAPGQGEALCRFSAAIVFFLALLLTGGLYLASTELRHVNALWRTAYGQVLMTKLAIVGCALLLGAYNRVFLTAAVTAGRVGAARTMRSIVTAEIILVFLALSATALWRFTPPPQALSLAPPAFTSVHLHKPMAMATVSFWTSADLTFDIEVAVSDAKFEALDVRDVTVKLASVDGAVAPFVVPLKRKEIGVWRAENVQAPCACEWNVAVKALVTDFDLVELNGRVKLTTND
jgi:copper transport protein